MKKQRYNVVNVRTDVVRAISKYCKEEEITQARYLSEDKRIKSLL